MNKFLLICTLVACWLYSPPEAEAQSRRKKARADLIQTQPSAPAESGRRDSIGSEPAARSATTRNPGSHVNSIPDIGKGTSVRKTPGSGKPYAEAKEVSRQLKQDRKWRKKQWKKRGKIEVICIPP